MISKRELNLKVGILEVTSEGADSAPDAGIAGVEGLVMMDPNMLSHQGRIAANVLHLQVNGVLSEHHIGFLVLNLLVA